MGQVCSRATGDAGEVPPTVGEQATMPWQSEDEPESSCQLPRFFFGPTGIFIFILFFIFLPLLVSGAFSYFFPVPRDISQNFPFPIA